MQSINYRDLLREIHGESVDKWYESEEDLKKEQEMGEDTIMGFIAKEVWKNPDNGKWIFKGNTFKRKGQAEKAAAEFWKKRV